MKTKREYLAGLTPPLAKMGRGRFSAAAKEAIAEAEKNGMVFADSDSVKKSNSDSSAKDSAPKVKKDSAKRPEDFFGDTPEPLYDGGWYVFEDGEKKTLSGREVCRTCMNSLDWHRCASPTFPAWNGEMLSVLRMIG